MAPTPTPAESRVSAVGDRPVPAQTTPDSLIELKPPPLNTADRTAIRPDASRAERRIRGLLARADIKVGGNRPWDIAVGDPRFYSRLLTRGPDALGDAYVDGWWECPSLDLFFEHCFHAHIPEIFARHPRVIFRYLKHRLFNLQTETRASRNIRHHYDLGNDLFQRMLDPRLIYSCGYWRHATTLAQAQEAKLDLVCRKIGLRPGMTLLDIGCGWGGFVKYAAERYGIRAVGITLSPQQASFATDACRGLPVEIRIQDYRELGGRRTHDPHNQRDTRARFDRIVSIGMFEHVGAKNHRRFMRAVSQRLAEDGLFLLHTFASRRSFPTTRNAEVNWIETNIFPGLLTPSMKQIGAALDDLFVIEDVHNFGPDYDPTLMAWHANFEHAWDDLKPRYDERFRRMWRFYLLCSAAAFRTRRYQLWQLVLSKNGIPDRYTAPR